MSQERIEKLTNSQVKLINILWNEGYLSCLEKTERETLKLHTKIACEQLSMFMNTLKGKYIKYRAIRLWNLKNRGNKND
jgi:hypothetical protein